MHSEVTELNKREGTDGVASCKENEEGDEK